MHLVSTNGDVYISWHVETGSYILAVDEYEKSLDEGSDEYETFTLIASSIYHLSLSSESVHVIRSCYTVTPRSQRSTTGGNISQVSSHGILITNLCAGHYVKVTHSDIKEIRMMKKEITDLKENMANLQKNYEELLKVVQQVYYAPGMPGYQLAKDDYLSQL